MEQGDLSLIQQKVAEVLKEQGEVLFAYVFGSTSAGTARKRSDVDVAVYLNPEHREAFFDTRLQLLEKLTRALDREADVVILNTALPLLKYVVLKEGQLVFEREEGTRIDFELKALNEYFDYLPILEQYHNRLRASV